METPPETLSAAQPKLTFVVRVWPEQCMHGNERWRGEVVHLASGQRRPFFDLATAVAFIRAVGRPARVRTDTADTTTGQRRF